MRLLRTLIGLCLLSALPLMQAQQAPSALNFQQALQLAQKSPKVQLAQLKLEQAQRQLTIASSPVSAAVSSGYSYGTAGGDVSPISLSASLNVIPYGPAAERVQQARWAVQQARLDAQTARATALTTVAQDYLGALRAAQNETLQTRAVKLAQQSLNVAKAQRQAGTATSADVLQAQITLQTAQNDLATATRTYQQALGTLSLDLGREVKAVAGEPGASTNPPGADLDGEALDARLEQRSDVYSAKIAALEAQQSAADTLRNNLPSATLSTGYSTASANAQFKTGASLSTGGGSAFQPTISLSYDPDYHTQGAVGPQQNFQVGISLSVPLDPSLPATLEASKLTVQGSQLAAKSALAQARLEVQTDRNALAAAQASATQSQALLTQSQQSAADAQAQYKLGLLTRLQVQQALQAEAEAKLNLAKAQDQVLLARMALAQALALDPLEVFSQ